MRAQIVGVPSAEIVSPTLNVRVPDEGELEVRSTPGRQALPGGGPRPVGGVRTSRVNSHYHIWLRAAMTLALALLLTSCVHKPQDSARETLLSLSYMEFDQTPGGGWRTLEKDKRHREAVVLIEQYLKRHRELPPKESGMLHFHAAQLLATEGESRQAIVHLKQARCDGQIPGYNEFADAMRAFLQRDRDELLAIRERVGQYPPNGMTVAYQSVVESFVERFDGSYNDVMAYELAKKKR